MPLASHRGKLVLPFHCGEASPNPSVSTMGSPIPLPVGHALLRSNISPGCCRSHTSEGSRSGAIGVYPCPFESKPAPRLYLAWASDGLCVATSEKAPMLLASQAPVPLYPGLCLAMRMSWSWRWMILCW